MDAQADSFTTKKGRGVCMKQRKSSCESCMYYEYDEDYECYVCGVNLDVMRWRDLWRIGFTTVLITGWGMNTLLSGIRCSRNGD